ncbi:MAG TPA: hypothetical protein VLV31_12595 [Candidatus Acidoferrales bacterium]|nr:hypothetical protein [Candidatus Acidoferrales bacterium]
MNQVREKEASRSAKPGKFRLRYSNEAIVATIFIAVLASAASAYGTTTTQMSTANVNPQQNCGMYGCYQNPSYPGYPAYPGYGASYYPYSGCYYGSGVYYENGGSVSSQVQCYGNIYQAANGCTLLVVEAANVPYYGGTALQYYTLHNLPNNTQSGTLVRVEGQMYKGYNTSPTGAACPGNYINVATITNL